ncbi:MAG: phosphate uptake regulator PhoU [bacterium]
MFKSLLSFMAGHDWTKEIVESFDEMVGLAEKNFGLCADHLLTPENAAAIRDELYARDREINEHERTIRRRVITHIAARPSEHEIPTAIVLTSLVKDAERIGDYVKNLYEVHRIHDDVLTRESYDRHFDGIRTTVKKLFADVRKSFRDGNAEAARDAITRGRETMRRCEAEIREIAATEKSVPVAVALVLIGRHLKRIVAHLVNIATAVVVPADRIDYYDERGLEDPGDGR